MYKDYKEKVEELNNLTKELEDKFYSMELSGMYISVSPSNSINIWNEDFEVYIRKGKREDTRLRCSGSGIPTQEEYDTLKRAKEEFDSNVDSYLEEIGYEPDIDL